MVKFHNWGATIINCILPSGMKQFCAQKVSKTSAIKKNFYFFCFKTMINGDEMLLIYPRPPPINIYPQHEKLFRWTGFAFIDFYSIPNCCSFFLCQIGICTKIMRELYTKTNFSSCCLIFHEDTQHTGD